MQISDAAFSKFKALVNKVSGIHLSDLKKQMVASRLIKRVRHHETTYEDYYTICLKNPDELQKMIDIITTNETSFFREMAHFDFMKTTVFPAFKEDKMRIWSAAASIGAEAYSIAMTADEVLTPRHIKYEVVGTDINTEVIQKAKNGVYPMELSKKIDSKHLKKHCLRGFNSQDGFFLIDDYLKSKCSFMNANLMEPLSPSLGKFDIIFLRNMLIYFDNANKKAIVENVAKNLKVGGYLFIGHSETLSNITNILKMVKPTVYKKEA